MDVEHDQADISNYIILINVVITSNNEAEIQNLTVIVQPILVNDSEDNNLFYVNVVEVEI